MNTQNSQPSSIWTIWQKSNPIISVELEKKWRRKFSERALRCNTFHDISHWTQEGFRIRLRKISRELKALYRPGEQVLDLGSGPGAYANLFQAPVLYDYAVEVFSKSPSSTCTDKRVCGEIHHLPFKDQCFDGLLCVGVLQCCRLTRKDIVEAARPLKPGGWFLFETLNCESAHLHYNLKPLEQVQLTKFIARPETDPCFFALEDYTLYQAEKLLSWFEAASLRVSGLRYLCFPDPASLMREWVTRPKHISMNTKTIAKSFYWFGRKEG